MRCADMKRHKQKMRKKMDAERGFSLLMSAINNDSFCFFFFGCCDGSAKHWVLVSK